MVYDLLRPKFHVAVCWKITWKPCIPRKFSFIMWLALKNRLSTKDRLIMEVLESDCSLCVGNKESAHHLFFRCPFVLQVWTKIRDIIGFPKKTIAIRSTIKWIHRLHKGSRKQDHGVAIALACSIYHIWRFRNLVVHEAVDFNLEGLAFYLVPSFFVVRWIPGDAPMLKGYAPLPLFFVLSVLYHVLLHASMQQQMLLEDAEDLSSGQGMCYCFDHTAFITLG
nr:Ribonuclease H protein [Ipomoea batatas]